MGVPRLFPWLVNTFNNFPNIIKHFKKGEYIYPIDYLYLDANGMLHNAAQKVFSYGAGKGLFNRYSNLTYKEKCTKVYELFFKSLLSFCISVVPQKVLYIAIDGPAPLAKQSQQRERRFISAKDRVTKALESKEDDKDQKSEEQVFDSSSISPGTEFMEGLDKYLNYIIRKTMNDDASPISNKNIDIIYSPPTVPGEGEHKIMDYIRSLPSKERNESSHCLFGPDGDLIMLTLSSHVKNMYLYREDNRTSYDGLPRYFDYVHFINMGLVRKELPKILCLDKGLKNNIRIVDDIINDFIVQGFFVGNDFLPKIPAFDYLEEGLEFMFKQYTKITDGGMKNFLTNNSEFSLDGFRIFVNNISKYETDFLEEQVLSNDPKKKPKETKFINHTLIDSFINGRLNLNLFRLKYYGKVYGQNITKNNMKEFEERIDKMCYDYIKTFIWVFDYYVNDLTSWRWAYRHHYPPLLFDLNNYLNKIKGDNEVINELFKFEKQEASLPFVQLLSVLSPYSAALLPEEYRELMIKDTSKLKKLNYYQEEFNLDCEGKRQDHECVALLEFTEYDIVEEEYNKIAKNNKNYKRNIKGNMYKFRYDKTYKSNYRNDNGIIYNNKVKRSIFNL